jgi:hypothetical protein
MYHVKDVVSSSRIGYGFFHNIAKTTFKVYIAVGPDIRISMVWFDFVLSCVLSVANVSRFSIIDRHFGFLSRLFTTYSVSRVPNVVGL